MTVLGSFAKAYTVRAAKPVVAREPRLASLAALLGTLLGALVARVRMARSEVLQIGGLIALCAGSWTYGAGIGLLATGVALFVLEWLTSA